MKGLAFLNADGVLCFRPKEFLDENPSFVSSNADLIMKAWRFDTEDFSSMYDMFSRIRDLRLSIPEVTAFAKAIGFDISSLKVKP